MRLVAAAQASGSRAQALADRAAALLFYVARASGALTPVYQFFPPSSSVLALSIRTDKWIDSRCGPRRLNNDYGAGKLPLKKFFDPAYLVTQCSMRHESEIGIEFAQRRQIVTPTVIDVR